MIIRNEVKMSAKYFHNPIFSEEQTISPRQRALFLAVRQLFQTVTYMRISVKCHFDVINVISLSFRKWLKKMY